MKSTLRNVTRVAIVLLFALESISAASEKPIRFVTDTVSLATRSAHHRFTVEIARTSDEMRHGLMFREHLAPDHGMLFLYDEDQIASFWMKDTLIPLDLLFIDRSGRIVRIHERAVPLSTAIISSREPVRAVLEVNGGTARRLGIEIGDRVIHPALGGADPP